MIIRYQLLFEQKHNFMINVGLINQKAAMFIKVNDFHQE